MSESPLISVKELEAELSDDNLLILDVRASLTDPAEGRRLYDAGHIPGARVLAFSLAGLFFLLSLPVELSAGIRCRIPGASASICGVSA